MCVLHRRGYICKPRGLSPDEHADVNQLTVDRKFLQNIQRMVGKLPHVLTKVKTPEKVLQAFRGL